MASLRSLTLIMLSFLVVASGSVALAVEKPSLSIPSKRSAPTTSAPVSSPKITVTSPAAGGSWKLGSSLTVAWSYSGDIGPSVSIHLLKGAAIVYTLAGNVPSDKGNFNWTVPKDAFTGQDYSVVMVSNSNSNIKGVSGIFSLSGGAATLPAAGETKTADKKNAMPVGSIIVSQPAGAEEWQPGTSHMITWNKMGSDKSGNVNIVLLKGDSVFKPIAVNVPMSSGKYNWLIPANTPQVTTNSPMEQYRVQIVKTTDSNVQGTSDFFSIFKPGIVLEKFSKTEFTLTPDYGLLALPISWSHVGTKGAHVTVKLKASDSPLDEDIGKGVPIGLDGKGEYLLQLYMKVHILKYGSPVGGADYKSIHANIKVTVDGTNYSATSETIILKVAVPTTSRAEMPSGSGHRL